MKLYLRNRFIEFDEPVVMGVLNVTPDSFSDGGEYLEIDAALRHTEKMIRDGAQIIDIGGESSRPGAAKVSIEEEIDRAVPIIRNIKDRFETIVSIDTYKERVAREAVLEAGADIVNDISALRFSEHMAETIARLDVPVILMHIKGTPENMQKDPSYTDITAEIKQYFHVNIDIALSKGIKKEKIIIDPGIGFGKKLQDNIEIIKKLSEFKEFEVPILIGVSRKSFLGAISGETNPAEREAETISANLIALMNGASLVRVHNVRNAVKSIKIFKELV
ncbi:MAG: dihydropteroate synthase [Candidatus Aminicenantes bacterium]|nr:dihydropteroate synthase [Candidatus Aminicenantes bacterium]